MRSKNTTDLLRRYIKNLINEEKTIRRLRVFDFDDTLVLTDAKVWVTDKFGVRFSLTPGEYAIYEKHKEDVMDFSEFHQLINPREIKWVCHILRNVYNKHGSGGLVILSARSSAKPIEQFLVDIGLQDIEVKALSNADPSEKAKWIDIWIRERNLNYVEFFDDSHKNIDAVRQLRHDHPDVKIVLRHVVHSH